MNRFSHIMIASDLDGTFLGTGSTLVARNLEAIRYFTEHGGHFTFATGRVSHIVYYAVPHPEEILNMPAVTGNGTCLYDFAERRAMREYYLSFELIKALAAFLAQHAPDISIRASSTIGSIAYDRENPYVKRDFEACGIKDGYRPLETWRDVGVYKLAVLGAPERVAEVYPEIIARFGDRAQLARSASYLIDVQALGRTKAVMLQELKKEAFSEPCVLCTVGDYENDLEMHGIADLACCPSNALDCVKDVCNLQFCSNDEGVIADLVEYLDTHDVSGLAT